MTDWKPRPRRHVETAREIAFSLLVPVLLATLFIVLLFGMLGD